MMEFWKPKPKQPWQDWRTYTLIVPLFLSSVAFALFSVFTYALDDIAILSPLAQSRLILIAAFAALDEQIKALSANVQALADSNARLRAGMAALQAEMERELAKLSWPVARKADFDAYVASLNGGRGALTNEALKVAMAARELAMPSPSTVRRWLDEVN